MDLQVAYDQLTGSAVVQNGGEAAPAEHTVVGTFTHPNPDDLLGPDVNHVLYHHVRDVLYFEDEWNMQRVTITSEVVVPVAVTGVTLEPSTVSVAVAATSQLTATVAPANATDQTVAYASDTEAVATVDAAGLVTGVAVGTATITVTTTDGAFTDTTVVTVTAV